MSRANSRKRYPPTVDDLAIMQQIADGEQLPQIAATRGVTVQSMKNRMRVIYDRMGADNRAHAVAMGFRRGLLT